MKKIFMLLAGILLFGYQPSFGDDGNNSDEELPINYVTISSNGTEVAQVIVPTENYGECEVLWTTIDGLTCEGQVISYDKFAIATFVNGVWQQNKHENWDSPTTDSGGQNISGTGEGGSMYYNFRYSIGTPTTEFGGGTMQNGIYQGNTIITRKDNNATANCGIYENYFEFDFNDGAWFQISFDGKVLYTSELVVIDKYSDTYGVSVKNFIRTDSIIEFDLIDGEYSETKFAHYVIDNKSFTTDVKGSAANSVSIYAHGNTIIIENATEEICVYDAMGRLICRDATPCVRNEKNVNAAGVYIVKVGNVAKRVMVN
ncbi:MAG: hypothetical protein IKO46_04210 [Salinivirgaceae bacterium]|nr:hypothetical protein [Salinivirgaceae bacterium]MBR4620165.1 hypothetical protein [Salinivirgaceae bacterium]